MKIWQFLCFMYVFFTVIPTLIALHPRISKFKPVQNCQSRINARSNIAISVQISSREEMQFYVIFVRTYIMICVKLMYIMMIGLTSVLSFAGMQ